MEGKGKKGKGSIRSVCSRGMAGEKAHREKGRQAKAEQQWHMLEAKQMCGRQCKAGGSGARQVVCGGGWQARAGRGRWCGQWETGMVAYRQEARQRKGKGQRNGGVQAGRQVGKGW